jgi:hypothetical protein
VSSNFFDDLSERYNIELDDLRSDSEGKDVLNKVLQQKRDAFKTFLPMLEEAPEMIAPALHGAFKILDRRLLDQAANSAPGLGGFPRWAALEPTLQIAPWARPMIAMCLEAPDGDAFLVTAAVLEWMLNEDIRRPYAASTTDDEPEDDVEDLGQAGEDWMTEQGFDSIDR